MATHTPAENKENAGESAAKPNKWNSIMPFPAAKAITDRKQSRRATISLVMISAV